MNTTHLYDVFSLRTYLYVGYFLCRVGLSHLSAAGMRTLRVRVI